eukprot:4873633-Amphidinium_carterae.1
MRMCVCSRQGSLEKASSPHTKMLQHISTSRLGSAVRCGSIEGPNCAAANRAPPRLRRLVASRKEPDLDLRFQKCPLNRLTLGMTGLQRHSQRYHCTERAVVCAYMCSL